MLGFRRGVEGTCRLSVRTVASATILTVLGHMISPTVMAAKTERQYRERVAMPAPTADEKVASHLAEVQQLLAEIHGEPPGPARGLARSQARQPGPPLDAPGQQRRIQRLRELSEQLNALEKDGLESFQRTEAHLRDRDLPDEILRRHEQAVGKYRENMRALLERMKRVRESDEPADLAEALRDTHELMRGHQQKRSHRHLDPENLPFGTPRPVDREPGRTSFDLQASLFGPVHFASLNTAPVALQGVQLATYAPEPDDLTATPDAPITPAIEALAEELDHDPVSIANWVHNHIEYLPTFGSIQGAEGSLNARRGNAFDTASLLIALLRAADVPARYRHGTIRVPVDQAMNWVGGVDTPEAALQLLGQGGVPSKGLTVGGVIRYIELEHAWVEAWLPVQPGRGAGSGEANGWIPLDAAFKQYDYSEPMPLDQAMPFDGAGFAQELLERSTVDETEGWVRGIDAGYIQQQLEGYQTQLEDYLATEAPDATVADVIGGKTIREQHLRTLRLGHPYHVVASGSPMVVLPANLRHKFRFTLRDRYGSDVLSFQRDTVELAGRRLALSFRPASQADEETIASYLPEVAEGEELDLDDLPETLPGYLIHLVPQWTVDGEVVSEGASFTMGTELARHAGVWEPNQGWQLRDKPVTVGEYHAVGLNMQGMAEQDLRSLQADLETTRAQLEAGDIHGLTKHDAVGDLLQSAVLSYMALNDVQDQMASRTTGVVHYRAPSFGNFSTNAQVVYWFGLPRDVRFPGLLMDIDQDRAIAVARDADPETVRMYTQARGARISANEHLVPEELFSTEENPAHGVSAVKALALANTEGQRIWTVTQANQQTALANITVDGDVRSEIQAAVTAGKHVTVHEQPIRYHGWEGTGYVVLDPETGAGAWKISGGANGGELSTPDGFSWVVWLLSLLDTVTESPIVKLIGGWVGNVIKVIIGYDDVVDCGWVYAIAKFYFDYFITIGLAFMLLPFIAIAIPLFLAIAVSLLLGRLIAMYLSAQWSCQKN